MTTYIHLMLLIGFAPIFLGFFGEQAVRLLRESWDGTIKADPETGLIRPRGATTLAEELFTMLDDNIPQTQNAPVTLNQKLGDVNFPSTPLTINNGQGGNAIAINGGSVDFGGGGGITIGDGGGITIGGGGGITVGAGGGGGSINVGGIGGVDITLGGITVGGEPIGGGGGLAGLFLGKVLSGSGDTYRVALYGLGSTGDPTDTVTATVPRIAADETIPPGTWVDPVHKFLTTDGVIYQFQPPVWLS